MTCSIREPPTIPLLATSAESCLRQQGRPLVRLADTVSTSLTRHDTPEWRRRYHSLSYSALACISMGMFVSASFQILKNCWYSDRDLGSWPCNAYALARPR